jgi:hypothetical protein
MQFYCEAIANVIKHQGLQLLAPKHENGAKIVVQKIDQLSTCHDHGAHADFVHITEYVGNKLHAVLHVRKMA